MAKEKIIEFFNKCAPYWDEWEVRKEAILSQLLDNAGISEGIDVLDIACGTGILFPDYVKRNVHSVTAIDLSPEMARIAKQKCEHNNLYKDKITVVCGDAETYEFQKLFDAAMIFNAFPHFMEPEIIIAASAKNLKSGGRLAISHDMGRQNLDHHHGNAAKQVSIALLHENDLKKLMMPYFNVDIIISNESMYQVVGVKR